MSSLDSSARRYPSTETITNTIRSRGHEPLAVDSQAAVLSSNRLLHRMAAHNETDRSTHTLELEYVRLYRIGTEKYDINFERTPREFRAHITE